MTHHQNCSNHPMIRSTSIFYSNHHRHHIAIILIITITIIVVITFIIAMNASRTDNVRIVIIIMMVIIIIMTVESYKVLVTHPCTLWSSQGPPGCSMPSRKSAHKSDSGVVAWRGWTCIRTRSTPCSCCRASSTAWSHCPYRPEESGEGCGQMMN